MLQYHSGNIGLEGCGQRFPTGHRVDFNRREPAVAPMTEKHAERIEGEAEQPGIAENANGPAVDGKPRGQQLVFHPRLEGARSVAVIALADAAALSDPVADSARPLLWVRADAATSLEDVTEYFGATVAERALAKGIENVVFDRGGYIFHGRVAALAEGAREGGLKF